nr:unnamed protein product [Naegleria fowleri]
MFPLSSEKKNSFLFQAVEKEQETFKPQLSSSPSRLPTTTTSTRRVKERLKEKSKKGYENIVNRLHQHLEKKKLNQHATNKSVYESQAIKMKQMNRLINSIDSWTLHSIEYHLKEKEKLLRNSLPCLTQKTTHYDEKKKEDLIKLATLEAKERCTIRKRVQEKRASLDAYERLLQYQYKRRKSFERGQLTLFKDEYYEEEMNNFMKEGLGSSTIDNMLNTSCNNKSGNLIIALLDSSETMEMELGQPRPVLTSVNIVKRMPDEKLNFLTQEEIKKLEAIKEQKRLENEQVLEMERKRKEEEHTRIMQEQEHYIELEIIDEKERDLNTQEENQPFSEGTCVDELTNSHELEVSKEPQLHIHMVVKEIMQNVITRNNIREAVSQIVGNVIFAQSTVCKKERPTNTSDSDIIHNFVSEILARVINLNSC